MTGPGEAFPAPVQTTPPAAPRGWDVLVAGLAFAVLVVLLVGLGYLANLPGSSIMASLDAKLLLTVALLIAQNLAILAGVGLALWRRGAGAALLGLTGANWRRVILGFLAGIGIALGLGLARYGLQQVFDFSSQTPGAEMLAPAGFTWLGFALMLLVAGLFAPFCEEVLFRGLLFGWLRQHMRPWLAALVSALPFGLLHIEPQHVVYATAAGFLLALVYQRSGSLWSSVAAHMAINLLAVSEVYIALAMGVPLDQI